MSRRNQRGTALVEFVWLAILLLVPLVYIVLAVFETQRTSYAAAAAARSASRAFLTAPEESVAAQRARVAARIAFDDQAASAPLDLQISCRPRPHDCLSPGSVVTVRVRTHTDLPLIPAVLGEHTPHIRIESEHAAPYGSFREGR